MGSTLGPPGRLPHINSPMQRKERKLDVADAAEEVTAMALDQRESTIVMVGVVFATIATLLAAFLFENNYGTDNCNGQVCLDEVSISSVSLGLVAIGNPISIGVVSFSSFLAIGIIPIAPISIGLLPIGLAYLGFNYINFIKDSRYILEDVYQ
tara:strand:+ start:960 stop:1418 length:459 start_codon:yes stop_codon:yes gene_type:complete